MADKRVVKTIDGVTHIVTKRSKKQQLLKQFRRLRVMITIVAVGVLLFIVGLVFLHSRQSQKLDTVTGLTTVVSKHVLLPKGELPIIATVTDKSALKTPFLQEANNGDRILIYEKAKRVIIYRPSADRIVDIGPVELSNIPKSN